VTLLDRYRARRDDPYRAYPPHPRWGARIAVGAPVTIAIVVLLISVLAAVNPGVKQAPALGHVASLEYRSLLIPSKTAAKFTAGRSSQAHGGRANAHSASRYQPGAGSSAGRSTYGTHARGVRASQVQLHYRTDANGYRIAPSRDVAMIPTTTWLAHLEHSKRGYPGKYAFSSDRKVPGSWYGYPSILPVIDATADRLRVRLAQRPDESTTWITRSGVVMSRTHWAILVDISQHWLYVFYNGIQQESFPVGTGARGTPTPTGSYFLAFHAPPNGPGYGSVMLETSAHSRVIQHFEGGNDAIIAIHGPISSQSDAEIGNHGAAISNGCIRMHDADLDQVKHVPNGAPVILTD
jgi:lipoprotein-anchoring transpeptidase ErfK/SrfK